MEHQRASATLAGQPSVILFLATSEEERQALSPRAYQTLQNFADTHLDYDAPGLLDRNGIVVASLEELLLGKDRSFRDYFQASIQGQPYVSDMLVGRATGRPGVFLTNPVVTAEGKIVGIDIVWLKGDVIWGIIDDVVVGEEGMAYLVDQDGVIIAHPNRDLLYHSLGELTPEAVAMISSTIRFGTVEGTDTPLIPESLGMDDLAAELVLAQGSGTYRYDSPLDHRAHVIGYTRLEAHPWTVVVDLPEAQFLAPLQRLGTVAWGSVGVVAAITLIVSILLVRGITHPIRRLTDAAIAVERDQPFEPADIEDVTSGRDEIAHLGRVFSGMVLALQQELTERKRAEEELQHTLEKLRKTLGATIQAMAFTVETKDPYTAGHQRRVTDLARAIATEMGLSKEQIEGIRMAAVIHDIGKITVPTDILNKPGRLTGNEFGIIKCHPTVGYDVLKTIEFPWPIAQIIFQHHERMDGSGYPQGLSGEEIILEARILAVADVIEAMASFRPYRPARGLDKALEEISQNRGVLYDPAAVDACLKSPQKPLGRALLRLPKSCLTHLKHTHMIRGLRSSKR